MVQLNIKQKLSHEAWPARWTVSGSNGCFQTLLSHHVCLESNMAGVTGNWGCSTDTGAVRGRRARGNQAHLLQGEEPPHRRQVPPRTHRPWAPEPGVGLRSTQPAPHKAVTAGQSPKQST